MAGMFDDLVPGADAKGMFDDLVPQGPPDRSNEALFGQRQPTRGQAILDENLLKGITGFPGLFGNLQELRDRGADWLLRKSIGAIEGREMPSTMAIPQQDQFPTSETFHAPLRAAGVIDRPENKPATTGEKYLASAAEGAGAMLPFGPFGTLLGTVSGVGGQAGEDATGSPWGRILGAFGAPLPLAAGKALLSGTPGKVIAGATSEMTPQQWEDAARIFRNAQEAGTPITGAEAIAQATGGNRMQAVQRVTEQSRGGGPTMDAFMAGRSDANRAAIDRAVNDYLGPPPAEPANIAPRVQAAAEGAIKHERGITNQLSEPAYAATSNNPNTVLSGWGFTALQNDPVVMGAIEAVKGNPAKYGDLSGLPNNSLKVLDQAKKYLDDAVADAQGRSANYEASNLTKAQEKIVGAIDHEYPRYASARNIQSIRQTHVEEPLRQSPVGDLANIAGGTEEKFRQARAILFPRDPETLTPAAVTKTIGHLRMNDPDVAREMTRQFLTSQFDKTTRDLSSGANAWGAAKFKATIAGGEGQATNLEAAVRALPNGDSAWRGLQNLLEVFEAQGKRHVPGSMTEPNRQLTQELSNGVSTLTGMTKPTRFIGEWWEQFRYGQNTAKMAELLTDPDSVRKMQSLAMFKPASDKAALIAAEVLGLNRETSKMLPPPGP
jgi:hypothetical protein